MRTGRHRQAQRANGDGLGALVPGSPRCAAIIRTGHPDRYLARLGKHAAKMGSGLRHRPRAHGSVTLDWGRWTAQAAPGTLTLRAEAADPENPQKVQDMLTTRLEGFGRREHLTVTWQPPGTRAAEPGYAG